MYACVNHIVFDKRPAGAPSSSFLEEFPPQCGATLLQPLGGEVVLPFSLNLQRETHLFRLLDLSFVVKMAKLVVLLLCCMLVTLVFGQHARDRVSPWTQRIQWENNGHVYSLLSTGTEYHSPLHSRRDSRVYLSSRSQAASPVPPGESFAHYRVTTSHSGPSGSASTVMGPDGRHYILASGRATGARLRQGLAGAPGARRYVTATTNNTNIAFLTEFSGSGVPRRPTSTTDVDHSANRVDGPLSTDIQELHPESAVRTNLESARMESVNAHQSYPYPTITGEESVGDVSATAPGPLGTSEEEATPDNMVGDDPRNPLKNHRNTVFYNVYPSGRRAGTARTRRPPPGTGYGTRYFHNGELCVGTTLRTFSYRNDEYNI